MKQSFKQKKTFLEINNEKQSNIKRQMSEELLLNDRRGNLIHGL